MGVRQLVGLVRVEARRQVRERTAHEAAQVGRALGGAQRAPGPGSTLSDVPDDDTGPTTPIDELDDYLRTLEQILELFPEHPEPMAAVTMMFLDDCPVGVIVERFGKSKSSVYRWIEQGIELLKGQLAP